MPKYDLAVAGAGLAGLVVAASLSQKNKKVVLLDPADTVGGALAPFLKVGFVFHPGPALSYGFEPGAAFQSLYKDINIVPDALTHSSCYQVALPDRRITVYPDHQRTLDELRREFPREIDAVAKLYHDIRKESESASKSRMSAFILRHRSASGFVKRYRFSRELMSFFDLQAFYFYHQKTADLSFMSLISLIAARPLLVQGGYGRLSEQLLDIIVENGGEVRLNEFWPDTVMRKNRVSSLRAQHESFAAKYFLINAQHRLQTSILYVAIKDEVIPDRMCRNVLCLPDYALPERYFTIALSGRNEELSAPAGMSALTASFCMGPDAAVDEGSCLDHISALIPFLKDYLVFVHNADSENRQCHLTSEITFKPTRSSKTHDFVFRASSSNMYLIGDDPSLPVMAVLAARNFAKKLA